MVCCNIIKPNAAKVLEDAGLILICHPQISIYVDETRTYWRAASTHFRISLLRVVLRDQCCCPSWAGIMDHLMRAGTPHGITPYGTEAMHVLRAEKGFIIVGQETDGSVNPMILA